MKARYAIFSLLIVVVVFLSTGYHANYSVKKDVERVYSEFGVVNNVLSPLFDSYSLILVDSQIKVSHGQMTVHQYCEELKRAMSIQKKKIEEYSEFVKTNKSVDDDELFKRAKDAYVYQNKMIKLCENGDINSIHESLYTGEMYKIVDPITTCINKILDGKYKNSEKYKKDALSTIKYHNDVMIFATILSGILGIALIRCKNKSQKRLVKRRKKSIFIKKKKVLR